MVEPGPFTERLERQLAANRKWLRLSLLWVLSMFWIVLSPPMRSPWQGLKQTEQALGKADALLSDYIKTYGEVPSNLAQLKAYSAVKKMNLSTFDRYGHRFDYVRLGSKNYLLRSFLRNGSQTTIFDPPDLLKGRLPNLPKTGYRHSYDQAPRLRLYPAGLLLGADSPQSTSRHARLFVDEVTGQKRLVVSMRNYRNHLMIAAHDRIDEFFWLPGGDQIVFSATGSNRHRDGIFLWDLRSDIETNLINKLDKRIIDPTASGLRLRIALSTIVAPGPELYAFIEPILANQPLLPAAQFFGPKNLYGFRLAGNATTILEPQEIKLSTWISPLLKTGGDPLTLEGTSVKRGSISQRKWINLPVSQSTNSLLLAWQHYTEKEAKQTILPYAVWYLSMFYGIVAGDEGDRATREVLRTYGAELASSLIELSTAPSYVRLGANELLQHYRSGGTLQWRLLPAPSLRESQTQYQRPPLESIAPTYPTEESSN